VRAVVFAVGASGDGLIERFHEPAQAPQAFSQFGDSVRPACNGKRQHVGHFRTVIVLQSTWKGGQPASGYFFVGEFVHGTRINV